MAGGFGVLSTVTLVLLCIASGSFAEEKDPLKHNFSDKALAGLREKCKLLREMKQNKSSELLAEDGNLREIAKDCLEINSFEKLKLKKNNGLYLGPVEALELRNAAKVKAVENPEYSFTTSSAVYRKRRASTFEWVCSQIRSAPVLFLTATEEEILAMKDEEFIDCIPDIGKLTDLKSVQRDALLTKAKTALAKSNVCDMETTDLINLGVVALSFQESDLSCLPLDDNGLVTSLGILQEWTSEELSALATRYTSVKSLTDLSTLTSDDITLLGSILCGFTVDQLASLPPAEIGKSGAHIGELHQCAVDQLTQLVQLVTHADAYGPVNSLEAGEVEELGYLIAGLSGSQIKELTVEAIEGLHAEVIPLIPAAVLKEMTSEQMESFTDAQAVAVTDEQKAVMSDEQKKLLGDQATGGEEVLEEVVINEGGGGDSSGTGSFLQMSSAALILLLLVFLM